ncbi:hypothetical protein BN11_3250003 [Nostocoides australiense Ben110]|uniref:Uncharacterized protein n=1 Tax=Nostocoides australiense Ben110 TaxID=1193182 RepID=W6JXE6_9MICO|nr:hypothetical protein BN11_3250003 [Tetrasphaera australiensis Ben110]
MWELEPVDAAHTLVRHTYDWRDLTDEGHGQGPLDHERPSARLDRAIGRGGRGVRGA